MDFASVKEGGKKRGRGFQQLLYSQIMCILLILVIAEVSLKSASIFALVKKPCRATGNVGNANSPTFSRTPNQQLYFRVERGVLFVHLPPPPPRLLSKSQTVI
jgi:hypothetical protein